MYTMKFQSNEVKKVQFESSNRYLAALNGEGNETVEVWKVKGGK